MDFILAVAPYEDWAREHSPLLVVLACILMAMLVIRVVIKTMTRLILLSLVTMLALFVLIEKDDIRDCTQSCECRLAGYHVKMPACDPQQI